MYTRETPPRIIGKNTANRAKRKIKRNETNFIYTYAPANGI